MSRKVAPTLVVNRVQKRENPNSSISSINNSYLHESYLRNPETDLAKCHLCLKSGNSPLLAPCSCYGKIYHQKCLKKWLMTQLHNPMISVKNMEDVYEIDCEGCSSEIKFKAETKQRCRTSSQVCSYCATHKGFTFGIIFLIGILVGLLTYTLLLGVNVIEFCKCSLAKSTLLIALGVVSIFLLLIAFCCLLDCLRTPDYKILSLFENGGKSRKGSCSQISIRSGVSKRSRHKLSIQNLD